MVLIEHTTENGDTAQIVYRNGGLVDAHAVEVLCHKVNTSLAGLMQACDYTRVFVQDADTDCLMQVGWPSRPISKVQTALKNSFMTSGLYLRKQPSDNSQKTDQLIGLARATSDHVFNATIWDVLVDPAYQVHASHVGI